MDSYDETTYGERIAGTYDDWYAGYSEVQIDTLSELARGGRALELGIGTGRIALPLQQRGVKLTGIDASQSMAAKLHTKPGGEAIPVTIGDFADVAVIGRFDLIYVVFNTFYALLTQDEQARCFANVAQHLQAQGAFVIEAFVPDMTRFTGRQSMRVVKMGNDEVRIDATQHDPLGQVLTSQHVVLGSQGVRMYPVRIRYAWPTELDLMARLAGLYLDQRWSSWEKAPFTTDSTMHISVYRLNG
ncbi:MAG: class I SAM-dependent methyltransferase [Chloroflexota bacterium]